MQLDKIIEDLEMEAKRLKLALATLKRLKGGQRGRPPVIDFSLLTRKKAKP